MLAEWAVDKIHDAGIAVKGTDLFFSLMPDSVDNCITIYDVSGDNDIATNAYNMDDQGFQINVRGSYNYCQTIYTIHRLLVSQSDSTVDFELYNVLIQVSPGYVDIDEKGRRIYTASYSGLLSWAESGTRIQI